MVGFCNGGNMPASHEMLVGDDDDVDVVDRGHKWESSFHPLLVTKFT